jgi:hypothetical protein
MADPTPTTAKLMAIITTLQAQIVALQNVAPAAAAAPPAGAATSEVEPCPLLYYLSNMLEVEVCPFRNSSLGNRYPYVGILVPTRDPLPEGTLGKLVLHRNR